MTANGIKSPGFALTELQIYPALERRSDSNMQGPLSHENLVNPGSQAEALYDVLIYHAAIRMSPFFELITHSGTVNHGGGLRKYHEQIYANPCYYAQSSFAALAGATPVAVEIESAREKAPMVLPDLQKAVAGASFNVVDAIAAVSADALWLSMVHRGSAGPIDLEVNIDGVKTGVTAAVRIQSAEKPWLGNSFQTRTAISPVDSTAEVRNGILQLKLKPYSVVRVRVPKR